jgi:quinol monooxygenase YgiN
MIIVSGHLIVDPAERDAYLAGCVEVARLARAATGCVDFHLSADPIEPGRINIFEQWVSAADAEAFRGDGPSDQQQAMVLSAHVEQHRVADTISLT